MEIDLLKDNVQKEQNNTIEANIKQVSSKNVGVYWTRKKLTPLNEELRK